MPDNETDRKPDGPLKKGWTTGACAAAAAGAAFRALHTGTFQDAITITLPRGETPIFSLATSESGPGFARASVIKDAGDDPDVTHGAEIIAQLQPGEAGSGVTFRAGVGVGTVTKPGLPIAPGGPAINPGPRALIADAISKIAAELSIPADAVVTISVPNGEKMAEKTMNGRLGIQGGISILGTTGIVHPYSCSAWIASIRSGVDVARAAHYDHIAAATGRTSEEAIKKLCRLPDDALIDMGDFAGGLLKYVRDNPVPRLTIAGGFGKISKLADGHMDLHSARASINFSHLADTLGTLGGDGAQAKEANTTREVLDRAGPLAPALAAHVANEARIHAQTVAGLVTDITVVIIGRDGVILANTGGEAHE